MLWGRELLGSAVEAQGIFTLARWRNSLSDFCFVFEYVFVFPIGFLSVLRNSEKAGASEMSLPAGTRGPLHRSTACLTTRNNKKKRSAQAGLLSFSLLFFFQMPRLIAKRKVQPFLFIYFF